MSFNAIGSKNTVELFRYFGNPLRELFQSRHFVTQGGKAQTEGAPAAATDTADKWNGIEAPLAVREEGVGEGKKSTLSEIG